jgi:hypothetical protein|tara:strand:+ start:467 stop:1027 length:561 start_codon:yes stop_codon:yes gene_type:complete
MANITEILGTDSVSSSRPTINSNFELLNDELATITALLDPTTNTLTGLTNVSAASLSLISGGSAIATITSSSATFYVDSTFSGALNAAGNIIKSGTVGSMGTTTTILAPTSIAASAYFIDGNFTIPVGADGQEVTIIAKGAYTITAATGASLAATSISLDGLNSTVTLRCFSTIWYVIASHKATIL